MRGVIAVLAAVVAGLMLLAVPAAAQDDHGSDHGNGLGNGLGNIERNEWNIPIANLRVL